MIQERPESIEHVTESFPTPEQLMEGLKIANPLFLPLLIKIRDRINDILKTLEEGNEDENATAMFDGRIALCVHDILCPDDDSIDATSLYEVAGLLRHELGKNRFELEQLGQGGTTYFVTATPKI